jgi:hypothetical protein
MMLFPVDFDRRVVDEARRFTDDIVECDRAAVSVIWVGQAPLLKFTFDDPRLPAGSPTLAVQLITESRKSPLAPGRLVEGDRLRRHVRDSVEAYLRANGIEITRKVFQNAHV